MKRRELGEVTLQGLRKLRRWWLPLLVGVLGVAASLVVWQVLAAHESRSVEAEFRQEAEERELTIQGKIEQALDTVVSLSAFYDASQTVGRDDFQTFTVPLLSRYGSIQALEWIPRVPAAQREAHEEAARRDGFARYQIAERMTQGQMIRAGERDEYFPVYFVEPYEGNEPALGFDLASEADRLEALNRARDDGQLAVTARITLVQEKEDQFGFLAYIPVYRKGYPKDTVVQRRANLEGFILGVFRIGDIVEGALADLDPADLRIGLFDDSASPNERLLYPHVGESLEQAEAAERVSEMQERQSSLYHAATMELGGRQWRLVVTPTEAYLASQRTWGPIGALIAGLAITALLTGYLVVLTDRAARVERLVEQRTKELEERTEELRLSNEELEERNRQLLDARAQAATDPLTGLWNHRAFRERVKDEVSRAQQSGSSVGLIILDIDDFQSLNELLGYLAGDHILRQLALTLADEVKREDACRCGGGTFAVLLPGVDHMKTARVAERLRRAVEKRMDGNGNTVTVSLGVASFPDMAGSAVELCHRADAAMYWAKSAGKNRVADWSEMAEHRTGRPTPVYAADPTMKAPHLVASLVAALAAKDPTTSAHTERCSWYALKLAVELGLSDELASVVRLASLLHDIGKIGIPDEVLFKPGPLNDEERAQIKQHPGMALHMLGHVPSLANVTPAILHHHEHFDGSGYPDGLAGDDIPIASRILLVTDAFDAMTSDRTYRKALPFEAAIDELKRYSGSQFDPQVVEAFLKILSHYGPRLLHSMAATQGEPVAAGAPGKSRRKRSRRSSGAS